MGVRWSFGPNQNPKQRSKPSSSTHLQRSRQAQGHEPIELGSVVVRQRELSRGGQLPRLSYAPLAPVQGGLVACQARKRNHRCKYRQEHERYTRGCTESNQPKRKEASGGRLCLQALPVPCSVVAFSTQVLGSQLPWSCYGVFGTGYFGSAPTAAVTCLASLLFSLRHRKTNVVPDRALKCHAT